MSKQNSEDKPKLFVTGGSGFIGSHILQSALTEGYNVRALKRPGSSTRIPLSTEPEWVEGELAGAKDVWFDGVDVLLHLAAAGVDPQNSDWETCFQVNVMDSLRLWQIAAKAGVKRFVICGSCFEYGECGERYKQIPVTAQLEPTGPYHASKAASSMAAMAFSHTDNCEVIILRPFHVFGEGEAEYRLWPSLRKAALAGEDFPMTFGEQVRDFISVDEVTKQFLSACTQTDLLTGKPVIKNVGSGKPQSIKEFAKYWWQTWGAKGKLKIGSVPYRENEVMRYVPEIN